MFRLSDSRSKAGVKLYRRLDILEKLKQAKMCKLHYIINPLNKKVAHKKYPSSTHLELYEPSVVLKNQFSSENQDKLQQKGMAHTRSHVHKHGE